MQLRCRKWQLSGTVLPATPAPQIIFNGRDISGTTQNVLAGQQILFLSQLRQATT